MSRAYGCWSGLSIVEKEECFEPKSARRDYLQLQSSCKAWRVSGQLAQEWNDLLIELRTRTDTDEFRRGLSAGKQSLPVINFALYLVARKPDVVKLKPTIVAECRDIDVAKRACKALQQMKQYSLAPLLGSYEIDYAQSTIRLRADTDPQTVTRKKNLCGAQVLILNVQSSGLTDPKMCTTATVGGIVVVDGKNYAITAGHAFFRDHTDVESDASTNGASDVSGSRGGLSSGDSENSALSRAGIAQIRSKVYAEKRDAVHIDENGTLSLDEEPATRSLINTAEPNILVNRDEDWALVPVNNPVYETTNRLPEICGSGREVTATLDAIPAGTVHAITGVSTPAEVTLSSTASLLLLPGSKKSTIVWCAHGRSAPGDCGSWLVNTDGRAIAMIVAGTDDNEILCLPLFSIFQSIQQSLGISDMPSLPISKDAVPEGDEENDSGNVASYIDYWKSYSSPTLGIRDVNQTNMPQQSSNPYAPISQSSDQTAISQDKQREDPMYPGFLRYKERARSSQQETQQLQHTQQQEPKSREQSDIAIARNSSQVAFIRPRRKPLARESPVNDLQGHGKAVLSGHEASPQRERQRSRSRQRVIHVVDGRRGQDDPSGLPYRYDKNVHRSENIANNENLKKEPTTAMVNNGFVVPPVHRQHDSSQEASSRPNVALSRDIEGHNVPQQRRSYTRRGRRQDYSPFSSDESDYRSDLVRPGYAKQETRYPEETASRRRRQTNKEEGMLSREQQSRKYSSVSSTYPYSSRTHTTYPYQHYPLPSQAYPRQITDYAEQYPGQVDLDTILNRGSNGRVRVSHRDIHPEILNNFGIPWYIDRYDDYYIQITQALPESTMKNLRLATQEFYDGHMRRGQRPTMTPHDRSSQQYAAGYEQRIIYASATQPVAADRPRPELDMRDPQNEVNRDSRVKFKDFDNEQRTDTPRFERLEDLRFEKVVDRLLRDAGAGAGVADSILRLYREKEARVNKHIARLTVKEGPSAEGQEDAKAGEDASQEPNTSSSDPTSRHVIMVDRPARTGPRGRTGDFSRSDVPHTVSYPAQDTTRWSSYNASSRNRQHYRPTAAPQYNYPSDTDVDPPYVSRRTPSPYSSPPAHHAQPAQFLQPQLSNQAESWREHRRPPVYPRYQSPQIIGHRPPPDQLERERLAGLEKIERLEWERDMAEKERDLARREAKLHQQAARRAQVDVQRVDYFPPPPSSRDPGPNIIYVRDDSPASST